MIEHVRSPRRDGTALALTLLAVVIGAGFWFGVPGAVGAFAEVLVRAVIGALGYVLPIVLLGIAVALMRKGANPSRRVRNVGGGVLLGLSSLGLAHLLLGAPTVSDARNEAAGFLGYAVGSPLTQAVSVWLSVPIFVLCGVAGVIALSGRTVRELYEAAAAYLGLGAYRYANEDYSGDDYPDDDYSDDYGDEAYGADDHGDEAFDDD